MILPEDFLLGFKLGTVYYNQKCPYLSLVPIVNMYHRRTHCSSRERYRNVWELNLAGSYHTYRFIYFLAVCSLRLTFYENLGQSQLS